MACCASMAAPNRSAKLGVALGAPWLSPCALTVVRALVRGVCRARRLLPFLSSPNHDGRVLGVTARRRARLVVEDFLPGQLHLRGAAGEGSLCATLSSRRLLPQDFLPGAVERAAARGKVLTRWFSLPELFAKV